MGRWRTDGVALACIAGGALVATGVTAGLLQSAVALDPAGEVACVTDLAPKVRVHVGAAGAGATVATTRISHRIGSCAAGVEIDVAGIEARVAETRAQADRARARADEARLRAEQVRERVERVRRVEVERSLQEAERRLEEAAARLDSQLGGEELELALETLRSALERQVSRDVEVRVKPDGGND